MVPGEHALPPLPSAPISVPLPPTPPRGSVASPFLAGEFPLLLHPPLLFLFFALFLHLLQGRPTVEFVHSNLVVGGANDGIRTAREHNVSQVSLSLQQRQQRGQQGERARRQDKNRTEPSRASEISQTLFRVKHTKTCHRLGRVEGVMS